MGAVLAVVVAVALAACSGAPGDSPTRNGELVASPAGSGSSCTTDRPCGIAAAIDRADDGDTITLLDGEYGDLTLDGGGSSLPAKVTIEPDAGATATIGKLDTNRPGLTWKGVTFTGGIYIDKGAGRTTLDTVQVEGSGVFVHASGVTITGSTIENGTSVDGVQVGGATDLLIEGSTISGFGQGADSDVHSDCVQIFDSSDIVIRGNYIGGCDNSALIFSVGGGTGISSVTVEGNQLQGCVEKTDRCSQGTALDLREPTAVDIVVRNNTILDGSVMVEPLEGLVFDRNIVGYLSNCNAPMTNSIVENWNTGKCDQPDALGSDGNRQGAVSVVDRLDGDLRLVDPTEATIEPTAGSEPAPEGFSGQALDPDVAGAGN